jgi:hypothetical protein
MCQAKRREPAVAGFLALVAFTAGCALASCDGGGGASPGVTPTGGPPPASPSGSPPTTATPGGERASLTAADDGTTLNVRVGALLSVQLVATPGYRWAPPRTSDTSILGADQVALTPGGGVTGAFHGLTPGTAQITATEDPTCLPACGRPSRLWRVTIVVTPHPVP